MAHSTLEEEIQIHRVFKYLAVDIPKQHLACDIQATEQQYRAIADQILLQGNDEESKKRGGEEKHTPSILGERAGEIHQDISQLTLEGEELERLQKILNGYHEQMKKLDHCKTDDELISMHITAQALEEAFRLLGKEQNPAELEETIWEVDDSLTGTVTYEEFTNNFHRCKSDVTGIEPSRLYTLVSLDELMHMLYLRHGQDKLQSELEALFGDKLALYSNGEREVTFSEYLSFSARRRDQLLDHNWFKMMNGLMIPKTAINGW